MVVGLADLVPRGIRVKEGEMKVLTALVATMSLAAALCAQARSPEASGRILRQEDVRQVAPVRGETFRVAERARALIIDPR